MTRACIRPAILVIAFFFLLSAAPAQKTVSPTHERFLHHLAKERLYKERLFFLDHAPSFGMENTFRVVLEKAWTLSALDQYDSAAYFFQQVPLDTMVFEEFHYSYLRTLFLGKKWGTFENEVTPINELSPLDPKYFTTIKLINLCYSPEQLDDITLGESIKNRYRDYHKIDRKSPVLAGIYSTLIPGTGKVYTRKWRQGLNAFIANLVLGLQTYEAYRKTGLDSARFYIFGGLLSIFYIGNIYGAIVDVNKTKRDYKHELHHEIVHYYYNDLVHPGF